MKPLLPLLLAAALLSACGASTSNMPIGNTAVPQPAQTVAADRYVGLWYEQARYPNRFEDRENEPPCEGVTAEYQLRDDGKIDITNTCRKGRPTGAKDTAKGVAKPVEGSEGSKYKVSFFGPLYVADYWVLERAEDYSWAIVGEPTGKYLWLLTRAKTISNTERQMLYSRIEKLGYSATLLRPTKQ